MAVRALFLAMVALGAASARGVAATAESAPPVPAVGHAIASETPELDWVQLLMGLFGGEGHVT